MKTVLSIAGFDPSSGAGVTADLMVFAAHALFGTSCITALTVQNTLGVLTTQAVSADTITATLDCLYADMPPAGIKIGMLATAANVGVVADFLRRILPQNPIPVVLDPVLKSSYGNDLLDADGIRLLRSDLLPLVTWITPNIPELSTLAEQTTPTPPTIGRKLQQRYPNLNIVATGGTLNPPIDILLQPNQNETFIEGEYMSSSSTHGTGCAFSSALLSRLVLGDTPLQAAQNAKSYVANAIRLAPALGSGHGPLHHLWPLHQMP